ncbi:Hypothetical_protein [Hexamita inflata]|uniref:Hypothetical_protein n=1 Tax=Hexamita inflata TaxID=28002 RepID=A0ABP1HRL9_9EUKA
MWYILQGKCLTSWIPAVKKWIQVWTHYWKAIELNVVSSIKVFHILTKMCRGVILLQLQVMLLSDGSVTCLRTQELTIEFMVVPHGINHNGPLYLQLIVLQIMHENSPYFTLRENTSDSTRLRCSEHSIARFAQHFERYSSVYQKVLQYSIGCFRFIRAKFKLSNLCFSVSFGFILATQKLKLNLARRRDTVVRDMEIPRRAQYFSAMIRRVSNLWLWRYLTTRKSQLSQIF